MNGRHFALIVAASLFVLFAASNLIANSWFRGARIDLTESQVYSLSRGAKGVLRDLDEPLQLTFYYSRDAAARYPIIQAYASRVRELLGAFAANARGRLRIVEIDPKVFSDAEDQASAAGVQPNAVEQGGDPIYFGLSGANAVDDQRAIPFFAPDREAFLEYEITRLIYELENPHTPKVALITTLPLQPAGNPMAPQQRGGSAFASDLGRFMEVERLAPDFTAIPEDADVLAVLHPWPLSPAQLYAIDQFILAKGRAFIALDPASMASLESGYDPMTGPAMTPPSSNIGPLLEPWGVAMSDQVVLDLAGAIPVRVPDNRGQERAVPQPVFLFVDAERLNRDDLMTAWLQRGITFGMSGVLTVSERQGVSAETLARTTPETMRIPAEQALARPSPFELLQNWIPANRAEILAVRLSGNVASAYPGGPPEGAVAGENRLARSARPAQIVLVADSDFLSDDLYINPQQGASFADNGAFALNALDVLTGSDAMVSLRSRAPSFRRMILLDRMEAEAQRRIEQRQTQLQAELQATEARLQELQTQGQGSGFFAGNLGAELSRAESAELDRFRTQLTEVRHQLRAVGRDLRRDIDALQAWTVFLNVWLGPLLVAAAGLFVFWRRRRQAGARA
ncbi:MAG: Gldg family protein [Hyphomonadaceae bacterium]|nr:Gldg family protein [Hyphomonadaceae bacterium]